MTTETQTTALVYGDGVIDICRNEMVETTLDPIAWIGDQELVDLDVTAVDLQRAAEALLTEHGWTVTSWRREVVDTAAGYARVVDIEPTDA